MSQKQSIATIFCLAMLGFAANWFRIELFFNVEFIFGSIFVLLASARFGVLTGIATGVSAGACTWLLWQHPWALVIGVVEAAVVGMVIRRRKISLLAADTLYWLCCGAPLVWLFYHHVMGIPEQPSVLMVLKQSLNGISNALVAQLLQLMVQAHRAETGQLPRFRQILSTVMLFLVLLTGMAALVTDLRDVMKRQMKEIIENTEHTSTIAAKVIVSAMQRQRSAIEVDLDETLQLLGALVGRHKMEITLLDRTGRIVVSTTMDHTILMRIHSGEGETRHVGGGVIQWIPPTASGNSVMQRWRGSRFVAEQQSGRDMPWKIVVVASPESLLNTLTGESILDMTLLLLMFLSSSLLVTMLNRMFLKPLEDLQNITGEIAGTFPANQNIIWPVPRLFELDALGVNFRTMVVRLNEKFITQENTFRQLAQETEKRRQLELQMLYIREQVERGERSRISRDLHDSLGQSLQAVKLNLQIMKKRCNNSCGYDGYIIDDAISEIGETSEELRDIVAMIKPPVLRDKSLKESLEGMVERFAKRSGVRIALVCSNEPEELDEELKSGLFRICQEALANALRHGKPTEVEISISCSERRLTLTIKDDGCGFDPYLDHSGSGIAIMNERAALLGGVMQIKSYPGKGAGVSVEVKLP